MATQTSGEQQQQQRGCCCVFPGNVLAPVSLISSSAGSSLVKGTEQIRLMDSPRQRTYNKHCLSIPCAVIQSLFSRHFVILSYRSNNHNHNIYDNIVFCIDIPSGTVDSTPGHPLVGLALDGGSNNATFIQFDQKEMALDEISDSNKSE